MNEYSKVLSVRNRGCDGNERSPSLRCGPLFHSVSLALPLWWPYGTRSWTGTLSTTCSVSPSRSGCDRASAASVSGAPVFIHIGRIRPASPRRLAQRSAHRARAPTYKDHLHRPDTAGLAPSPRSALSSLFPDPILLFCCYCSTLQHCSALNVSV